MIHHALFFELGADALFVSEFLDGMEFHPVGMNLQFPHEPVAEQRGEAGRVELVNFFDVQDEFVALERVVVAFAQFHLPSADVFHVVEHVLEVVEIHQGAFEFIDPQFAHVGAPGNLAHQPRHDPAAERARLVEEPAVDAVPRAVPEHHAAPGVERGEHDLARFAFPAGGARGGIDNLQERQVRVDVVSGGPGVLVKGALGPGEFGLGEPVGAEHVDLGGAELGGQGAQFAADPGGGFFPAEHDFFEAGQFESVTHGLGEHVVEERGERLVQTEPEWRGTRDQIRTQPPALLPRPPIQRQGEIIDLEQQGRSRLVSNSHKRMRSQEEEEERQILRRY